MLTLCVFPIYISLHPSLHALCMINHYSGFTEYYSISFLFLFFFHLSSLYPIKIFVKYFYLLALSMTTVASNTVLSWYLDDTRSLVFCRPGLVLAWFESYVLRLVFLDSSLQSPGQEKHFGILFIPLRVLVREIHL